MSWSTFLLLSVKAATVDVPRCKFIHELDYFHDGIDCLF